MSEDEHEAASFTAAEQLAHQIRRRREAAGLSQKQLARQIVYTRQYMSLAERVDQNVPSLDLTRKLDDALNAGGALIALRAQAKTKQATLQRSDPAGLKACDTDSSGTSVAADIDISGSWTRSATLDVLDEWVSSGLIDRRTFHVTSGAVLATIANSYLDTEPGSLARALDGGGVSSALLNQIESTIPLLQQLDDANGGAMHLAYVGAQFRSVAMILRQHAHPDPVQRRLFMALAEIGQLAGWMAFDAGHHGHAQRYFITALRAAHECGYRAIAAHILADLTFQAATRNLSHDAIELGSAAARAARATPAGVRASVATRVAYGHALNADIQTFNKLIAFAHDAFHDDIGDESPTWMYYLTPNHLDSQTGYALIHAGVLASQSRSPATATSLLRRGEHLLRGGAHQAALNDSARQRRALFEGSWLAVASAYSGDYSQACLLGDTALKRTTSVHSSRCTDVLRVLRDQLLPASNNKQVNEFLSRMEQSL